MVDFWGITQFFEQKDEFIIDFQDAVSWIGERAHDGSPAGRVGRGYLLPDYGPHIIHSHGLAKLNNFGSDGDDFIPSIIHRTGELVADIDTEPATLMKDTVTLVPYQVEMVDISLIRIMESDLI